MKAEQVDQALRQKFVAEGARLVFWHDSNGEFADYVDGGLAGEIARGEAFELQIAGGQLQSQFDQRRAGIDADDRGFAGRVAVVHRTTPG